MSSRTDTILREAFEDLAGSAPVPGGLARAALGRARRQRLRQAGLVGGAAVACATAIGAGVVVGPADPTPPPQAIAAGTRTIVAFGQQYGPAPSATPEPWCPGTPPKTAGCTE
ncbi:hypothetical protein ACFQ1L_17620 [Phytohabitans flavus]|uniref:hypothetical protein n=1 Tax=Phytohabitans flavus TaxID=1076124 RepID=UPI0036439393